MARTNSNELSSFAVDWKGRKGVRRRLSYRVSLANKGLYRPIDISIREYLKNVKTLKAPATHKRYRSSIWHFQDFLRSKHPKILTLGQLDKKLFLAYQIWRREADPLDPPAWRTIQTETTSLKSWLFWECEQENLAFNPISGIKKLKFSDSKVGKVLTPLEFKRLITMSELLEPLNLNHRRGMTDIWKFLVSTGLRKSELIHLEWNDIDFEQRLIKIQKKDGWNPKTYSRLVPFSKESARILKALYKRQGSDVRVFRTINGAPLHPDKIRKWLLDCARGAYIDGVTGPHDLRRTFIDWSLNRFGMSVSVVMKIVGHQAMSTTQTYCNPESHISSSMKSFLV